MTTGSNHGGRRRSVSWTLVGRAATALSSTARMAGAKGGRVTASDREHMAEIGRKGAPKRKRKNVEKEGDSE